MALMNHFSTLEQKYAIAFLYQVVIADLEIQIEEQHLLKLLLHYTHLTIEDIEDITLIDIKQHLLKLTDEQLKELLFMSYAIMRVDRLNHPHEQALIRVITDVLDIDFDDFKIYYQSMVLPDELTVLDKAILLNLTYYMIHADEKVDHSEAEFFMLMCEQLNVHSDDATSLIIPKETLYQTILTLNKSVVTRIVEELLLIATSDLTFDEREHELLLPILNHFRMDLLDIEQRSKVRLIEHMEYYRLFHTTSGPQ